MPLERGAARKQSSQKVHLWCRNGAWTLQRSSAWCWGRTGTWSPGLFHVPHLLLKSREHTPRPNKLPVRRFFNRPTHAGNSVPARIRGRSPAHSGLRGLSAFASHLRGSIVDIACRDPGHPDCAVFGIPLVVLPSLARFWGRISRVSIPTGPTLP